MGGARRCCGSLLARRRCLLSCPSPAHSWWCSTPSSTAGTLAPRPVRGTLPLPPSPIPRTSRIYTKEAAAHQKRPANTAASYGLGRVGKEEGRYHGRLRPAGRREGARRGCGSNLARRPRGPPQPCATPMGEEGIHPMRPTWVHRRLPSRCWCSSHRRWVRILRRRRHRRSVASPKTKREFGISCWCTYNVRSKCIQQLCKLENQ